MTTDELDELSKKLFDAAREERGTKEARDRVLRASLQVAPSESRSRTPAIVAVAALAAGVAGLVWFGQPRSTGTSIDREAVPHTPTAAKRVEPREPRRAESERPATAEQPKLLVPPRTSSAGRAPATLAEELALLEEVRSALAGGSSGRALELIDRYERTLRGTHLRAEATILRIEALAKAGKSEEAARLAREFVEKNSGSPLVDRARSFAGDAAEGPERQDPGRTP